jgi:hypothetical protein
MITGFIAFTVGFVDPLEGSILVVSGIILLALGAFIVKSYQLKMITLSLVLVLLGVGAMWILSSYGGVGGSTGRSYCWALIIVPYPIGWIIGLITGIRLIREK